MAILQPQTMMWALLLVQAMSMGRTTRVSALTSGNDNLPSQVVCSWQNNVLVRMVLFVARTGCTHPVAWMRQTTPKPAYDHAAPTYVAFGNFRAYASFDKETPPQVQPQFRKEARLAYLKAIEVDPKYLPAHLALARLLLRMDNYAAAAQSYAKATELAPQESALWYELGLCQCRQKQWNEAITSLAKCNELNPSNKQATVSLGFTLARAGRFSEALALLAQAIGGARANYDLGRTR